MRTCCFLIRLSRLEVLWHRMLILLTFVKQGDVYITRTSTHQNWSCVNKWSDQSKSALTWGDSSMFWSISLWKHESTELQYVTSSDQIPPPPRDIRAPLTCSLVHGQLIGQDPANLAEGGHLDAILLQLTLHVVDLLLWGRRQSRRNRSTGGGVKTKREGERGADGGLGEGGESLRRQTVPGSCVNHISDSGCWTECRAGADRKSSHSY